MLVSISFFDAPTVLDCSVTNIPGSGSSPLQVVASLPKSCDAIFFIETTSKFICVYSGVPGQEILAGIIGQGSSTAPLIQTIPKGARVSLRNFGTAAVTSGSIHCSFLAAFR